MSAELSLVANAICSELGLSNLGPVGSGAFKVTFQVQAPSGEYQALKVIRATSLSERTVREVDAMQRCRHSSIAKLLSVDSYLFNGQEYTYILEEFLSGGTLTELLNAGSLTVEQVKKLGEPLIDALAEIERLGLVHRDIKPDNVMFRAREAEPVIVDFGLVRDLVRSSLTNTWQMVGPGTPFYAPPEQLTNEKHLIDWRSDQFSLGVVLAYCVTGMHPYQATGDTEVDVVTKVASRSSVSSEFSQSLPVGLLPALRRMVAPWPIDRFRTPQQLAEAWELQGAPI